MFDTGDESGMFYRPTAAIINLDHLVHNFGVVRKLAGPQSPLAPVVKSNAYGHGMLSVAGALLRAGAEWLAVSLTEEGLELRESGITGRVLVLGGCYPAQSKEIVSSGLTPVISTGELARSLNEAARSSGKPIPVHLKVETGLGRLGILPKDLPAILQGLKAMPFLILEGICTTFSSVDNLDAAKDQLRLFEGIAGDIGREWGRPLICHIAHTGALLRDLTRPGWLIRPGIIIYGYTRGMSAKEIGLKPVLTWRTEIYKVQEYPEGYPIGYSGLYRAPKGSRIALLPVGYSDGLLRSYMGTGEVLIRGKRAPLTGRFSMDWTMAEVGHIPEAKAGDEVILIGTQGEEWISAEEMADRAQTIVDEIFVSIASRVPRIFKKD
jgi:alanine racemase